MSLRLECTGCGNSFAADAPDFRCGVCGEPLEYRGYVSATLPERPWCRGESILDRYSAWLPLSNSSPGLSMGEGFTPLIEAPSAAGMLNGARLLVKNESVNPTWSFKDRGTVVAATDALQRGFVALGVVSTGNMAASVAAYGSRAGLPVFVMVSAGIPDAKLAPIAAYGPTVVRVDCDYPSLYDASLELALEGMRFLNSDAPARIEGSKTIAFEIWEQLDHSAPDWLFVPTSSGGNLRGVMKGFMELREAGLVSRLPTFVCVQALGCAPIAEAWLVGSAHILPVEHPRTIAHAIENPRPPSGDEVLRRLRAVGGIAVAINEEHILEAQRRLAFAGILAQPAGAIGLAGAENLARQGLVGADETIVCLVTGSGLKQPPALEHVSGSIVDCSRAEFESVVRRWVRTYAEWRRL